MSYSSLADVSVREHVVARRNTVAPEREPLLVVGECMECGAIIYPNPSEKGYPVRHQWQQCTTCHPSKDSSKQDSLGADNRRKVEARANGQLMYETAAPCPKCDGRIAFVVGSHCVRCVQRNYEAGMYEDVAPVPSRVVVPPLPKPKRVRVYVPKVPKVPKPTHPLSDENKRNALLAGSKRYQSIDHPCPVCGGVDRYTSVDRCVRCSDRRYAPTSAPADKHRPKTAEHKAKLKAAQWRRYHPDSHEPVTPT
jgi:hypothetical protein